MKTLEGALVAQNMKVALVAARFNEFITAKLIGGALDGLKRHGVPEEAIHLAWVPGAFEIPLVASKLANSGKYDAVICLGAVIRGSTSHYDYVCAEVSKGIATVSLQSQIPVLFGVLTTDKLIGGALDGLKRHGVPEEAIHLAWVPGAFEIPLVASKLANSGKYDAVICLGAVIRGSTSHYDYVCAEVSKGIATVSLQSQIPVLFGVLTTDTIEQAIERAGTKAGNKGYDCALSAVEMVNLLREIGD